ncbi:hypothetical protein E2C01_054305 [Portunus trituberculatus]|uniref:Uncharacterized protein n=1 Tax=Portunus trituberculatus TaxID=210409 RepID=A0A5B7GRL7_PORTR|nr:hypothetical protein [Portunus trituberculatus]
MDTPRLQPGQPQGSARGNTSVHPTLFHPSSPTAARPLSSSGVPLPPARKRWSSPEQGGLPPTIVICCQVRQVSPFGLANPET